MKTKALISFAVSFAVTAKLICVFVFAYAKCWFSHEAAQITMIDHLFFFAYHCSPDLNISIQVSHFCLLASMPLKVGIVCDVLMPFCQATLMFEIVDRQFLANSADQYQTAPREGV